MPVPAKPTPPWRRGDDLTAAQRARVGKLASFEVNLIIPADVGEAGGALAEKERLNPEAMAYRLLREGPRARGLWLEERPS